MIGGAPVTQEYADEIGADAARDAAGRRGWWPSDRGPTAAAETVIADGRSVGARLACALAGRAGLRWTQRRLRIRTTRIAERYVEPSWPCARPLSSRALGPTAQGLDTLEQFSRELSVRPNNDPRNGISCPAVWVLRWLPVGPEQQAPGPEAPSTDLT